MAKGNFGKFVLGLGIGACVGALLTPRTGEENRKLLKEKANDAYGKAKQIDFDALKTKLYDEYYGLKEKLETMDQEQAKESQAASENASSDESSDEGSSKKDNVKDADFEEK